VEDQTASIDRYPTLEARWERVHGIEEVRGRMCVLKKLRRSP
jgi:hypothetical protein